MENRFFMKRQLSDIFLRLPEGRMKNLMRSFIYKMKADRFFTIHYHFVKDYWEVLSEGINLKFLKNPFHIYKYNSDFVYGLPNWQPDIIVDAGAFHGTVGMFLAKKYPDSIVYMLEPDPVSYSILHKNIELNDLKNVRVVQKGLWDKEQTLFFHNNKEVASSIARQKGADTITIETITPVDLLNDCANKKIFFKMNIEGAEIEALQASLDLWKKNKIQFAISSDHKVGNEYTYKKIEEICSQNNMQYETRKVDGCITTYIKSRLSAS